MNDVCTLVAMKRENEILNNRSLSFVFFIVFSSIISVLFYLHSLHSLTVVTRLPCTTSLVLYSSPSVLFPVIYFHLYPIFHTQDSEPYPTLLPIPTPHISLPPPTSPRSRTPLHLSSLSSPYYSTSASVPKREREKKKSKTLD